MVDVTETPIRGVVPEWAAQSYADVAHYGDGYGYGDGDGDGEGDASYWGATLVHFSARWSSEQRVRLEDLRKAGATIAFWRSDRDGRAANGGVCDPVQAGTVHVEPGPLRLCGPGTLHATLIPPKWSGERLWVVAMKGQVIVDGDKLGALEREIIAECVRSPAHG